MLPVVTLFVSDDWNTAPVESFEASLAFEAVLVLEGNTRLAVSGNLNARQCLVVVDGWRVKAFQ
jgi:hypothetical protein